MALTLLNKLSKYRVSFPLSRTLLCSSYLKQINWYSTSKFINAKNDLVKYTTSNASKVRIVENLYGPEPKDVPEYQPLVVFISLASFMIYFCILREENDLDEILKGNPEYESDQAKWVKLSLYLEYCKKNHLPTAELEEKVEKLKKTLQKN